nr:hypothetical protein [Actinomycetales bacterium]
MHAVPGTGRGIRGRRRGEPWPLEPDRPARPVPYVRSREGRPSRWLRSGRRIVTGGLRSALVAERAVSAIAAPGEGPAGTWVAGHRSGRAGIRIGNGHDLHHPG